MQHPKRNTAPYDMTAPPAHYENTPDAADTKASASLELLPECMRIADVLAIACMGYWTYNVQFENGVVGDSYRVALILGVLMFSISANVFKLYSPDLLLSFKRQALAVSLSIGATLTLMIAVLFFAHIAGQFSRMWIASWFIVSTTMMLTVRLLVAQWTAHQYRKGLYAKRIVLVGGIVRIQRMIAQMVRNPKSARIVGLCAIDYTVTPEVAQALGFPAIATLEALGDYCREHQVDELLVTSDIEEYPDIDGIMSIFAALPCCVKYCIPGPLLGRPVADVGLQSHMPVFTIFRTPLSKAQQLIKRIMDVVLSSVALLVLLPVFLVVALLVSLDGQGHIFYRQLRHGFGGGEFSILKFRSMKVQHTPEANLTQATRGDRRVTKIGAFIRRTSIDELPQLVNVLLGDMSLVGPRPHALSHNQHYQQIIKSYAMRHRIKPGITGFAQVRGWRGETNTVEKMQKRVECDLYYIEHWSLWLDIKIMVQTVFAVFVDKNAY